MIRLRQTFGAHAGRVLELDGPRIRLGRMPDSEVAFDARADLDASGRHAEIRFTPGAYRIVDVGSRNGTFVNGAKVTDALLQEGDELELGHGGPRLVVEALTLEPGAELPGGARSSAPAVPPTLRPGPSASASLPPPTPDGRQLARDLAAHRTVGSEPPPPPSRLSWPWVAAVLLLAAGLGLLLSLGR